MKRVLIFDDEFGEVLSSSLSRQGFEVSWEPTQGSLPDLSGAGFAVVVAQVYSAGVTHLELCERLVDARPDLPVFLLTDVAGGESSLAVIRAGSFAFLEKPFELVRLISALEAAARTREQLSARRATAYRPFEGIVGESPAIQELCELVELVAQSDSSVLITGKTGTGKELVARAVHRRSARRDRPFIAVNCAAIPEPLLESDLFGHAQGAFTGARTAREGLLQKARGGSLFLDEVGDMPLGLQAKLLRTIEEQRVRPVGSDEEVPINVRFIAATHRDPEVEVERGTFREDLLYRLNVIRLRVPSLAERGEDILAIAQHYLERYCLENGRNPIPQLTRPAARKLLDYDWPGNVRELCNCIQRGLALTKGDRISLRDLPIRIQDHHGAPSSISTGEVASAALIPLAELERRYILRVLEIVGGNKARAARILGLDRRTLYRRLDQYRTASAIQGTPDPTPT